MGGGFTWAAFTSAMLASSKTELRQMLEQAAGDVCQGIDGQVAAEPPSAVGARVASETEPDGKEMGRKAKK